jgi:hypothetical protein
MRLAMNADAKDRERRRSSITKRGASKPSALLQPGKELGARPPQSDDAAFPVHENRSANEPSALSPPGVTKALGGRPPQSDDAVLPVHEELELTGWRLVRHCPKGSKWFKAKDQLMGTEEYGDQTGKDHPEAEEWSVSWERNKFDEFLFATGDGSRFAIIDRSEVRKPAASASGTGPTRVKASSEMASATIVSMLKGFNRGAKMELDKAVRTDKLVVSTKDRNKIEKRAELDDGMFPLISLVDFDRMHDKEGSGILYAGGSFSTAANAKEGGLKDDPLTAGATSVEDGGGANVYIRGGVNLNGLAVCLNGIVGCPIDPVPLYGKEDGMLHLWKHAPNAIMAGLTNGYYRLDTTRWLADALKKHGNLATNLAALVSGQHSDGKAAATKTVSVGDIATFGMDDSAVSSAQWAGCPGTSGSTRLGFSPGANYTVAEVRGAFFLTTSDGTLWAPLSALRDAPVAAASGGQLAVGDAVYIRSVDIDEARRLQDGHGEQCHKQPNP